MLSVAPLAPVTLDGDDEPSGLGVLTGTLAAILLFVSLQTFGTYVLTGVVEEKSSAVVEMLLVRASADQLLAGKVIGIGVAALTQFAAAVAAGLVSLGVSGVDVPGEIWSAVPMMLVWFLGGFALYSTLFALAGSLVSRQEDAQSAAAPIRYGLMAALPAGVRVRVRPGVDRQHDPVADTSDRTVADADAHGRRRSLTGRGRDRRRRAAAGHLRRVEAGGPHLRAGAAASRFADHLARRAGPPAPVTRQHRAGQGSRADERSPPDHSTHVDSVG